MTEPREQPVDELSAEERQALNGLLRKVARNAGAIEQVLDTVEHLGESGALAGLNATLAEFDDNFNAAMRPEVMSMLGNMMMLMGLLSEVRYEPFFDLAMNAPAAMNDAYPRFKTREEKLKLREAIELFRSPELASALELLVAIMRAQRNGATATTPPLPRTPGR
jgi:uncharacterized protein YjgD (DUF1641 family)